MIASITQNVFCNNLESDWPRRVVGLGQIFSDKNGIVFNVCSFVIYAFHVGILNLTADLWRQHIYSQHTLIGFLQLRLEIILIDNEMLTSLNLWQPKREVSMWRGIAGSQDFSDGNIKHTCRETAFPSSTSNTYAPCSIQMSRWLVHALHTGRRSV